MSLSRRTFTSLGLRSALASAIAGATSACGGAAGGAAKTRLLLNWFPEVEHGGFFAAEVDGTFAAEGLDVDLVAGRPDAPVIPQVAGGRAEFAISDAAEVLLARAQRAPVVALFAALQRSPRCVMVHAASGIDRLDELRGVTLAMSIREPFAHFLRARFALDGVKVVPYSGSVAPFLADPGLASQAYVFSEPLIAAAKGGDPRCLLVADAGFDPYASLLVTSEAMIARDPGLVTRMVRACQRGWESYLRDPAPANRRIAERNPDMDPALLEGGARALQPLCRPAEGAPIGSMSDARWRALAAQMVEIGVIDAGAVADGEGYTLRFLADAGGGAAPG